MIVKALAIYILIINIYSFLTMYYDKKSASQFKWRVSEKELFFIAFILGSLGIYAGMYTFRHKTKHKKFTVGIPLLFIINVMCVILIVNYAKII